MRPYYSGKCVLITGGSSGIGRATAELAASMGAHVAIVAKRQALLDDTLTSMRRMAERPEQRFVAMSLDLRDEAAVAKAVPALIAQLGGLDVLVNNAGIAHCGYLEQETADNYRRMIDVNYLGSVWMTQACLPHFRQQQAGHIAFVSSVLGLMGVFGYTAYCASKHALTGYADALRQDLLRHHIGVSVLFPADTDTPQLQEENRNKPPETAALAGTIQTASADTVAHALLAGIAQGRYAIVPGLGNQATLFGVRHLPALSRWVIDRQLRRFWQHKPAS